MPRVFSKGVKLKVIEYGDHCFQPVTIGTIWNSVTSFFRKFVK